MTENLAGDKVNRYIALAVATTILIIAPTYYFYSQYQQEVGKQTQNPEIMSPPELYALIKEVEKRIKLPQGETPVVATVSDKDKLKDQPFFRKAREGNKILIFERAGKAIIYDPKTKKVVDVAQIDKTTRTTATPSANNPQTQSVTVAIYNGTTIAGLAKKVAESLEGRLKNLKVVLRDNSKEAYTQTIVVDLASARPAQAKALAQALNGSVAPLPDGEKPPVATVSGQVIDLLVILGGR